MTTYTNLSNTVRAAKKALGQDAKKGVDFMVASHDGKFTWSRASAAEAGHAVDAATVAHKAKPAKVRAKAKAKAEVRAKPETEHRKINEKPLGGQPQVLKALKFIKRSAAGKTVNELCVYLGSERKPLATHTVRGMVSRAIKEGWNIGGDRSSGTMHYIFKGGPARLMALLD